MTNFTDGMGRLMRNAREVLFAPVWQTNTLSQGDQL